MRILLSNDDGYLAPGIRTLYQALKNFSAADELVMIAPDRNRSAASNSLTLLDPLRTQDHGEGVYSVNGTPTDCVHLGINGALAYRADMVISGINAGANMGDDVLYSGTVAAATEGRFLGKPSIAISLCGDQHFATAAEILVRLLDDLHLQDLDTNTIININVPDIPLSEIKGIKVTRLGKRHASEPVVKAVDPRGGAMFWIGPAGCAADAGEGTDFHAVEAGYVSVTPLQIDLTHYAMLEKMSRWVATKWQN
ncbi:5'/3'-nucleotidase SurE [Thiomicrospira microaerophila]|uniref:5'/3'-nucleotidase SurE n=1 Tax=Thiomicrospira microaerophila TaxID=406020 RepID=UPI00200D9D4D|nr:5'/3'-nucleotidase SurE [Thiomicrospira microaerophila]UQB41310.1 5'/3'-nucleotidase SurE [Thiomicrospira microaerophila]